MGWYNKITPLLDRMGHERAQKMALSVIKVLGVKKAAVPAPGILSQNIWGRDFLSPLGLAAGFDKNAEAIGGHFHLGFGFVELGTVTPEAQSGKAGQQVIVDRAQRAIVDRAGHASEGLRPFCLRLGQFHLGHEGHWGRIGANIGVNANTLDAAEDFRMGVFNVGGMVDYIVLNLSCPDAVGVPDLQRPENLEPILKTVWEEREKIHEKLPALLVKISPDINQEMIPPLCDLFRTYDINGLVISNAMTRRPEHAGDGLSDENAGLSGAPLSDVSTRLIGLFYRELRGDIPIIGCGGIFDGRTAYQKIKAGASLLELYTALVIEGPGVVRKILAELENKLKYDGFQNIADAVGSAHKLENR